MTEKAMTGRIEPIMARVSSQEMANKKMKETMINMKDLKNIDTLVERPS